MEIADWGVQNELNGRQPLKVLGNHKMMDWEGPLVKTQMVNIHLPLVLRNYTN